jgi:ankyrin repeat protein
MKYLFGVLLVFGLMASKPSCAKAQGSSLDRQVWQAAYDGNLEAVRSAVERGADVNARGKGGFSALLAAARNGHLDVVKYLVERGADINKRDNQRNKTPLLAASFDGHYDIVKYLVDKGADLNAQGVNGWTPLHDAAYIGNFEIVKYLVDHNADVGIRNERRETPLETARRGSRDAVRRGQTKATPEDYKAVVDYLRSHGG